MKDFNEDMPFAPVGIPTLNRFDHFRRCLESLMKCTHADKTEVYVALDYPAKDSHWEGYNKIKEYLASISKKHGFKKLHVIKRDTNFGVGPGGNFAKLREYIFSQYDSAIFSEDDNIFAPAFLDFLNKGLYKFMEDKSIFAICGYRHYYNLKFASNTFYLQNVDFSAWGYGIWRDRLEKVSAITKEDLRNYLYSYKSLLLKRFNGNNRFFDLIRYSFSTAPQLWITDTLISVYLFFYNMNVVMPKISLVRNMGLDGSGQHFYNIAKNLKHIHDNQLLDTAETVDYKGSGYEYYKSNRRIHKTSSYGNYGNILLLKKIFKGVIRKKH